jgi:hypothetical protein
MKLNILGLLAITLVASLGWSRTQKTLICQTKNMGWANFGVPVSMGGIGHLVYNYSSATLTCPLNLTQVLAKKGTIQCFGTWAFDRRGASTLAWVEITNDGRKISARTQTNRIYGSKNLNMDCEIKNEEVWE